MTLAALTFVPREVETGAGPDTSGVIVYGFIIFLFVSDTLWNVGYNLRREQKQGTLEQLYLSPASKFASLLSRVTLSVVWVGLLSMVATGVMTLVIGRLPFANLPLAAGVLALALAGTFGVGFAFAALTLRIRETAQTAANLLQFAFMLLCAPFFPFETLPAWARTYSRLIPLSYAVDAFRSTLMDFPPGFPELAPLDVELAVVAAFGLLMPALGYWLYRHEEDRARRTGTLSEY
jgi:ABC-2 type transport system permease protein